MVASAPVWASWVRGAEVFRVADAGWVGPGEGAGAVAVDRLGVGGVGGWVRAVGVSVRAIAIRAAGSTGPKGDCKTFGCVP